MNDTGENGSGAQREAPPGATAQREGAERTLEDWGRRVGHLFASAAAQVREEAEDIWAEAQSVRRGERD